MLFNGRISNKNIINIDQYRFKKKYMKKINALVTPKLETKNLGVISEIEILWYFSN